MIAWTVIFIFPLALILAAPVKFYARVGDFRSGSCTLSITWLCGGVRFAAGPGWANISVGPFIVRNCPVGRNKKAPVKTRPSGTAKAGKQSTLKGLTGLRRHLNRELAAVLQRGVQRLWSALHLRVLGEAVFGLGDPYLTGIAYGFCAALGLAGNSGLVLTPDFEKAGFKGRITVQGKLFAGSILAIAASLLLSRPVLRLIWPLLRRKEEKEING